METKSCVNRLNLDRPCKLGHNHNLLPSTTGKFAYNAEKIESPDAQEIPAASNEGANKNQKTTFTDRMKMIITCLIKECKYLSDIFI